MIEIKGKHTTAVVYTNELEESAKEQIKMLCEQSFAKDTKIRIMPDVHAGASCVIGFTAQVSDWVIPNIVGVDIGCGMLTVELGVDEIDLKQLDEIIHKYVPSGKNVQEGRIVRYPQLKDMYCYRDLKQTKRIERSIGSLGGGNHFIEVAQDENKNKYLVIHTGSRNLGTQVATYYQNLAYEVLSGKDKYYDAREKLIFEYKQAGKRTEIQNALKELEKEFTLLTTDIPKKLCYLTDKYKERYLHDMHICQQYATLNREIIADIILNKYFGKTLENMNFFETVHNYIDLENNIIRKGAISAQLGEKVLIPLNMRDGSLICIGKGNPDWNYSAPHGAGRLFSRSTAQDKFSLEEFKEQMKDVYTTSVSERTIDECPMAYKDKMAIIENISPTVDIIMQIKPIYNFKADN
ncbi:RNA-splicing ligase RtcB [Candidatus Epulonipiscioides gigas]|nr:RNA-splicing ligase RtcB [Epulopiscium sp. SCG-C07WGA-EpuloA2]